MKRSWIRFLLIVLLLLLPIAATAAVGFLVPAQFEMTFLGEFDNKVERLQNTDGPKVILVGGSSVAFGVDAELLEQTLGMPVINFGLYATLGTKTMLDYSKSGIDEGDIIVIAPEMNAQTFSLYFNAEAMWQAVDGHFSLLRYLDSGDIPAVFGILPHPSFLICGRGRCLTRREFITHLRLTSMALSAITEHRIIT